MNHGKVNHVIGDHIVWKLLVTNALLLSVLKMLTC
jgi:hypothetical protein